MRGADEVKRKVETALHDLCRVRFQAKQLLALCDKSLIATQETVDLGTPRVAGGQAWPEDPKEAVR